MKRLIEKWAGKSISELGASKRFFDAGDSDNAIRYGGIATGIMAVVKDMESALPAWEARDAEMARLRLIETAARGVADGQRALLRADRDCAIAYDSGDNSDQIQAEDALEDALELRKAALQSLLEVVK